jgi:acyl-CoA hydrolase
MTDTLDRTAPRPPRDSETEMVQVVLPIDANPLGFILGGTVMHLVDIAAAVAAYRHTRELVVTAEVDELQFLHPIKVGDLIVLKARVTATFHTSLEVEVHVYSEETLTGKRQLTSHAYLTFATVNREGARVTVRPLLLQTEEDERVAAEAAKRREERLRRRTGTKPTANS